MTKKQEELYNAIKKFIKENGYSPTMRELAKIVGCNSPATVLAKLRVLKENGYIDYVEGKQRTIRLKGDRNELD